MHHINTNLFESSVLKFNSINYNFYPLIQLNNKFSIDVDHLPYCIRVLLETAIRNYDGERITQESVASLASWSNKPGNHGLFSFNPARILLQDLTGVPLIIDLASLRSAAARFGKDPSRLNPLIPVDLVIDHSIQVDYAGSKHAALKNMELEYARNHERYQFLKWAQTSIHNFRVIPPGNGIIHQVNLEYLAQITMTSHKNGQQWIFPDSVLGTDSHTTMVNGIGVLGWGVGGIEAAAAMLGQPVETLIPDVLGIEIIGQLSAGITPTDIVLTLTHLLRKMGVVNKMVEFFGSGLDYLSIPDRAMIANMAPEYGATAAFFPVDDAVIAYLHLTGRSVGHIRLTEAYYKTQGLFRTNDSPIPTYTQVLKLDLNQIKSSMAGPKRPQDLVQLAQIKQVFLNVLISLDNKLGFRVPSEEINKKVDIDLGTEKSTLEHGSVVIAAITSCTNTSNPIAMISAGLLAKKAIALGLRKKPFVKTSLAPGSKAVMVYLEKAGLIEPLEQLGFHLVGFGCTTCIGNSGPLDPIISAAIQHNKLIVTSVTSGNRNFEGRIHPLVQANYLASPAAVVAYAICGSLQKDLLSSPLGYSSSGNAIFLKDIWPSNFEVQEIVNKYIIPETYKNAYTHIFDGDAQWQSIDTSSSLLYPWDNNSTYILESPFCDLPDNPTKSIENARVLAVFGDSITTDHISPAGAIALNSPAAAYLRIHGVPPAEFNTYGSRRGNHELMVRGTFANIRIKNQMLPGSEGGLTIHYPEGETMTIFDASVKYRQECVDLVILAGKEYGTGSSRDWAAKGPLLLGVKAIIAESFERIHRSNLVGMGILPLQFQAEETAISLGLDGSEVLSLFNLSQLTPGGLIQITAKKPNGIITDFHVKANFNSFDEIRLWNNGGILKSFSI